MCSLTMKICDIYYQDAVCMTSSFVRSNVKFVVKKRPPNSGGDNSSQERMFSVLEPLAAELVKLGRLFPKTIIFAKLKWYEHGREFVRRKLAAANCDSGLMSQYHASCTSEVDVCVYMVIISITD